MIEAVKNFIDGLNPSITEERKIELNALANYIQKWVDGKKEIRLNFICTHNSRRSHLSQIWAQAMANYFKLENVHCYSGGTEAATVYPSVLKVLELQGMEIETVASGKNPSYAIHFSSKVEPIIAFSKCFDDATNPSSNFAAIMTCSQADNDCPFISGASARIPIRYTDPKFSDGREDELEVYAATSKLIAEEMKYVFSMIQHE